MQSFDVLVRGAGVVGQCLALALARQGLQVAIRSNSRAERQTETHGDVRAFALNAASVALLRELGVWDAMPRGDVTAVHEMQVRGDAPGAALEFTAWQQRVDALAWIVDVAALEHALDTALRGAERVVRVDAEVPATLEALCEGRESATRAGLGVQFERYAYDQLAVAARLTSSQDHQNVAHQWFRSPDVLALLPLDVPQAQQSFALVWSCPTARAHELLALEPTPFEAELARATAGEAGALTLCSQRAAWPLMRATARPWCGRGWVLLGDAAHVVHPLAGQGLNLGLADVTALGRVIAQREPWRSLDDPRMLRRYRRERAAPTWAMSRLTDGLLQVFSHPAAPVRELRNRGLTLVNHLPPLKRWLNARAIHS
jgi:2-polyprenyl-6-methoxyphenol hydroxylase-like FAD-dependent oxidoreductase